MDTSDPTIRDIVEIKEVIESESIKSQEKINKYIQKENYITVHPDPNIWKHHANYDIMLAAKKYLKGDVCDLGCNHGAVTLLLIEFEDVNKIFGVDLNYKALEQAYHTARSIQTDKIITFICSNLLNISLVEDMKFDSLMSFHTLEHIYPEDAFQFVKESYRILKPGGYMLISIPYDHAYPDPHHVAFYTEKPLNELFESVGFVTIECFKDDRFEQKDLLTAIYQKPSFSFS